MTEAIVGINSAGEVRAVFFCIDTPKDERDAAKTAARWLREGRTVRRCSEAHAAEVMGKQWHEPNAPREACAAAPSLHADVVPDPFAELRAACGNAWDGVCAFRFVAEQRSDEDSDPPRCPDDVRGKCADETCPWRHNKEVSIER